jgi:ABC-type nickel/cobalt efflux system permease component RcnA
LWFVVLCTLYFVLCTPALYAHPIPRRSYDRTVTIRLAADGVTVNYRLEVDEWTVVFVDLPAVLDKGDRARLSKPREFYEAFTRAYGPILAENLSATLDGKPLKWRCLEHKHEVLDHLRCDFVFKAAWDLHPGQRHRFALLDGNYELESGVLRLSLTNDPNVPLSELTAPSEALKNRAVVDLRPGEDAQRRKASASFMLAANLKAVRPSDTAATAGLKPPPGTDQASGVSKPVSAALVDARSPKAPPEEPAEAEAPARRRNSLLALLDTDQGFWLLMLSALVLGAFHALTPGHGKTLVAAYLVGERGTTWHALLLGLVTTLTHTGVVLLLAVGLYFSFPQGKIPESAQQQIHTTLEMVGGLMIVGLGVWLLMRRLSGGADHIHLGGHGHHHHHPHSHGGHSHSHGGGDHYHDEQGHAHPVEKQPVGRWGLIVLGMQGGIVPCWDAIGVVLFTISVNRLWLALPMLLAFSAGLAGVLVLVGILVVHARGLLGSHWGEGRLIRALPLISALVITLLGLWMCYDARHPIEPHNSEISSKAAP